MKKLLYILILFIFVSCEKNTPTPEVDDLLGNWQYGETGYILRDGDNISADYPGFGLTFQEVNLIVAGGSDLFPEANDTWTYTDDTETVIKRNSDNLEIDLEKSEDVIILRFVYTISPMGGRVDEVAGEYEIKLERQ